MELMASAVTFAGDPDGTRVHKQTHKLALLYQHLIVYKSLHPSISLPLNKKASERWKHFHRGHGIYYY